MEILVLVDLISENYFGRQWYAWQRDLSCVSAYFYKDWMIKEGLLFVWNFLRVGMNQQIWWQLIMLCGNFRWVQVYVALIHTMCEIIVLELSFLCPKMESIYLVIEYLVTFLHFFFLSSEFHLWPSLSILSIFEITVGIYFIFISLCYFHISYLIVCIINTIEILI